MDYPFALAKTVSAFSVLAWRISTERSAENVLRDTLVSQSANVSSFLNFKVDYLSEHMHAGKLSQTWSLEVIKIKEDEHSSTF